MNDKLRRRNVPPLIRPTGSGTGIPTGSGTGIPAGSGTGIPAGSGTGIPAGSGTGIPAGSGTGIDRRWLLGGLLASGGALAAGCSSGIGDAVGRVTAETADIAQPSRVPVVARPSAATDDLRRRTLVMIEFDGGNDGLDTLVPYADPAYVGLRGDIGVDPETILVIDDEVALNPNLAGLHQHGITTLEGVGSFDPDLSHFESMRRWHQGDPDGNSPQDTGFLGRLCDQLDVGATVTGLSVAFAPTQALNAAKAGTLAIPSPDSAWWLTGDDPYSVSLRSTLGTLAGGEPAMHRAMEFGERLSDLPEASEDYEWGELSQGLSLAAQILDSDLGVRVIHVPFSGFDTHRDHRGQHDQLLTEVDAGIMAFLADLEERGLSDSVLVATYSEFGRRLDPNAGGTDHGTASMAMLLGPIATGGHGQYPSLTDLDDGNLRATVGLDAYYASIAESWFGIPTTEVLATDANGGASVLVARCAKRSGR